jgi:hypothetical protein
MAMHQIAENKLSAKVETSNTTKGFIWYQKCFEKWKHEMKDLLGPMLEVFVFRYFQQIHCSHLLRICLVPKEHEAIHQHQSCEKRKFKNF